MNKCLEYKSNRTNDFLACSTAYNKKKCRCHNCTSWNQQYGIQWRKENPLYNTLNRNKEKRRISNTRWAKKNSQKIKKYSSLWYEKNKNKKNIQSKEWYLNNKEKKASHSRKRRSIKNKVISEKYLLDDVIALYGKNCYLCNNKIDMNASRSIGKPGWQNSLHIEHIIPLFLGGNDTLDNVRPSHALCNLKKGKSLL